MHPILTYKERLILYLAGWLLLACLLASIAVVSGSLQWVEALSLTIPMESLERSLPGFERAIRQP